MLLKAVFVTAAAVILYVYGMHLMKKIDCFLTENHKKQFTAAEIKESAIVFGTGRCVKQISASLRERGIHPICLKEIGFRREEGRVKYMIAVSSLDVDNITMCQLARRFYELKGVYSVCNEEMNRGMYKSAGISILTKEEIQQKICEFSGEKEQMEYERII